MSEIVFDAQHRRVPAQSERAPKSSLLQRLKGLWPRDPAFAPPELPVQGLRPGLRVYAVGDIHGHAALLDQLLLQIYADLLENRVKEAIMVFLGDYVDRGPDSAGVIARLAQGTFALPHVTLRGNHEEVMLEALDNPDGFARWCGFGGIQTLESYGIDVVRLQRGKGLLRAHEEFQRRIPEAHRRFLGATKLSHSIDDYFFVHAGARPGVPLKLQHDADLLWIRREFLDANYDFGQVIVHGHTPRSKPESKPGRINVDTGAYKWGVLTAVVLEGASRRFLSTRDATKEVLRIAG